MFVVGAATFHLTVDDEPVEGLERDCRQPMPEYADANLKWYSTELEFHTVAGSQAADFLEDPTCLPVSSTLLPP